MPYPSDCEQKLGFDQIRKRLEEKCLCALGADRVRSMRFQNDIGSIQEQLLLVWEFVQSLERGEAFASQHFFDARALIQKIRLEGNFLEAEEFLSLAWSLQTIHTLCHQFSAQAEISPALAALAGEVPSVRAISQPILTLVSEDGTVKDNASAELHRIRRALRSEQARVRSLAEQVYRQAVKEKWVPEGGQPTIRSGRLVIPILAEYKRRLKGFIHDESATGQTVFMEPAEVLETNNEIRDLEHAERREVIRILRSLTDAMRQHLPALVGGYEFLGTVDFIRAKALVARQLNATLPRVAPVPQVNWKEARHPLLMFAFGNQRQVVPLTIELTGEERMLLISGPNAGGKSVCLKTVGLLQYMLQTGMLVPMSPDSVAGIFDELLVDIGDQQSIENDLSTYSSHLKNMAYFIRNASDNTLVLLDELGSGTDPNFGGAIAQSVLDTLLRKNAWGVATTHYYNLKVFAGQTAGIRNGAMRFDEQALKPLYIMDMGKPGSSFALEIARQTGLPEQTLHTAGELVGKELLGFERLIRELEREKQLLANRIAELEQKEAAMQQALKKYEHLAHDLEVRKKDIIAKSKQEAQQLLRETNREIEKTIRHIRENQAQQNETRRVRKNLETLAQRVSSDVQPPKIVTGETVKAGDIVRLIGQEGSGTLISVKGKSALVQFGEIKTTVRLDKLEKSSGPRQPISQSPARNNLAIYKKQATFTPVLDVRGKRVEEVISLVDQFMDTAILLSQGELRIIHGKGEGVLRKVIREHLRKYSQLASMADEHADRGGDGVTIVVLK